MKKNKILIGVISIIFAGIITLGIIDCNNSNTKDNEKLFIGNTATIRRRTKRHRYRKIFAMVRRIARRNKKL